MNTKLINLLILFLFGILASGCSGVRTFHEYARAGDTVALAAGWMHNFDRNNITVTFTPDAGTPVTYQPGDYRIRAAVNLYPDPLSSLIISGKTGLELSTTIAPMIASANNFTSQDPDWWQTTVILDVPSSLPVGNVSIGITNPEGEAVASALEIIPGIGTQALFATPGGGLGGEFRLSNPHFDAMARVTHYTVSFSTTGEVPYAIEVALTHDPDVLNGGEGIAFISNPRSEVKNILWSDDGYNTRVLMTAQITPTQITPNIIENFKFYVAGDVRNVQIPLGNVVAYDKNGIVVTGVTASISTTQ